MERNIWKCTNSTDKAAKKPFVAVNQIQTLPPGKPKTIIFPTARLHTQVTRCGTKAGTSTGLGRKSLGWQPLPQCTQSHLIHSY